MIRAERRPISMSHFMPGSRIGAYHILGELGEGGMGTVYRAVHTLLDRPAAIKVLHREFDHHPTVVERFLNEARATTAIRHPGIVEVYDYGYTDNGRAYIAMELLVGSTLTAYLATHRVLPVVDALTLARRITAPLVAAHERGIVHRDLKPDNVFLVEDPEGGRLPAVKVLDFGIAKLASNPSSHTTVGVMLGTPAYMAPEQCRGAADCDHRADLYALGCVLFEMVVGWPPFGGRGAAPGDLIAAHLQTPPPDARSHANVQDAVARLIGQLLAKSPEDRPRSAGAVIAAIDRCITALPQPAPAVTQRAVAIGVAIVLASGGALWWSDARTGIVSSDPAPALALPSSEAIAAPTFACVTSEDVPKLARSIEVRAPPPIARPPEGEMPDVVLPGHDTKPLPDVNTPVPDQPAR